MIAIFTRCWFLVGILFCGDALAQQVPNGGFETWTTVSYGEVPAPVGGMPWVTNDSFSRTLGAIMPNAAIRKVTDAHSGNYALCIQESYIYIPANNYRDSGGGAIFLGPVDFSTFRPYGVAYTARPQSLSGYYKISANRSGADTGTISVTFKQGGAVIGQALRQFSGNVSTYQAFTMPVSWTSAASPDKLELYMDCGGVDLLVNDTSTRFFLDDLAFDFSNGISESLFGDDVMEIFPNPASDQLIVRLKTDQAANAMYLSLHDASGKLVRSLPAEKEQGISVSGEAAGTYFLQLRDASGAVISGRRISVVH